MGAGLGIVLGLIGATLFFLLVWGSISGSIFMLENHSDIQSEILEYVKYNIDRSCPSLIEKLKNLGRFVLLFLWSIFAFGLFILSCLFLFALFWMMAAEVMRLVRGIFKG